MSESINAEFEAYVEAELGDIAVVSDGRYISPKIQNYYKVWQHREAQLADAKQIANDYRIVADNAVAEALGAKKDAEIGAAIQKAAGELPDGFQIIIELTKGCGDVKLRDDEFKKIDFEDADEPFHRQITNAIDAAIQAEGKA